MRFATIVLLPVAAVMAAPDFAQINRGVAEAKAAIAQIDARQDDLAGAAAADVGNSTGIGSALGDLTTLLSGLSSTLEGLCNLRSEISSLTSELGIGN